tara:strand:- start:1520 stop:1681 length:162 start_codon:yes stop_codon:yes gene_type:complete
MKKHAISKEKLEKRHIFFYSDIDLIFIKLFYGVTFLAICSVLAYAFVEFFTGA